MVRGVVRIYGEWWCKDIWCLVMHGNMVSGGVRICGDWSCKDIW